MHTCKIRLQKDPTVYFSWSEWRMYSETDTIPYMWSTLLRIVLHNVGMIHWYIFLIHLALPRKLLLQKFCIRPIPYLQSTPLITFLYTPYNKHTCITKWLFWNHQKSYKEVSHAYQLLVICLCYYRGFLSQSCKWYLY